MKQNQEAIAIYSRKSKFTGKGESIGNQIELCREFARAHYGDTLADQALVFEDEGFSGGNLRRPAFQRMMEGAKKRQFKAIIVYRLDRISRNVGDFSNLIEELTRLDIAFISIREQFDTGTPMGRAMMYIASVFSQLERETIAERIRDNMHELAKTGRWLGGMTPTGYTSESVKRVTVDGKTHKACKLKLLPEEAALVTLVFDLFTETQSLTKTEAELLRQRRTTKNGKEFTRFSIKNILQNPVYLIADGAAWDYFEEQGAELFSERKAFDGVHGILAYNRTDQEKGRAAVANPVSEWIVSVGEHEGMIPSQQWIKVQALLERNKSKAYRQPRSNEALLTGLLYCRCGSRMYPKTSKRLNARGEPVYTYVCKVKDHSKRSLCDRRNASGNTLDQAVIEQMKELPENGVFLRAMEQSKKFFTGDRTQYEDQLAGLREELSANEKKVNALVDSLAEIDGGTRSLVLKRVEALNQETEGLRARIRELEGLTEQQVLSGDQFELLRQLLSSFRSSIDEMTLEQKRAAVRSLVRKVIWDGEYAHIVLFGADENEIEFSDAEVLNVENGSEEDDLETPSEQSTPLLHWGEDRK